MRRKILVSVTVLLVALIGTRSWTLYQLGPRYQVISKRFTVYIEEYSNKVSFGSPASNGKNCLTEDQIQQIYDELNSNSEHDPLVDAEVQPMSWFKRFLGSCYYHDQGYSYR